MAAADTGVDEVMALTVSDRNAPVLDRLVTIRLAAPGGYYSDPPSNTHTGDIGDWYEHTRDETVWAARVDLKVDVVQTNMGAVESGGAVYVVRWFPVSYVRTERSTGQEPPTITMLRDDVGWRNVYGIAELDGYRKRYLEIRCAGTA